MILRLVVASLVLIALTIAPASVAAEYCRPTMPDHPSDASGYAFRGDVTGIRIDTSGAFPRTYVSFHIDDVYANAGSPHLRDGETIELYSAPCDGFQLLRLASGDDVLFSGRFLEEGNGPSTWSTAIWRVDGSRLSLFVLGGPDGIWNTSDRRLLTADTLRQALALVAPAAIGLPTTDASPSASATADPLPLLAVFLVAFAAIVRHLPRPGDIPAR